MVPTGTFAKMSLRTTLICGLPLMKSVLILMVWFFLAATNLLSYHLLCNIPYSSKVISISCSSRWNLNRIVLDWLILTERYAPCTFTRHASLPPQTEVLLMEPCNSSDLENIFVGWGFQFASGQRVLQGEHFPIMFFSCMLQEGRMKRYHETHPNKWCKISFRPSLKFKG